MLFQAQQNLEELLVRLLATKPGLGSDVLRTSLHKAGYNYSVPALYKELRKLQEQGIVVRQKRRYYLSIPWLLEYLSMGKALEAQYLQDPNLALTLPESGKSKRWRFSNLMLLDDFSSHVILKLLAQAKEKIAYSWNPHPWFWIIITSHELSYIKGLKQIESKFYKIIGGGTKLDQWTEKFWQSEETRYKFLPQFETRRDLYYNVVDDYIASFTLDKGTSEFIDHLYNNTKSYQQLDFSKVIEFFNKKHKLSFVIERNEKKANEIRARFRKIFR